MADALQSPQPGITLAPIAVTPFPVPDDVPLRVMPWAPHELRTPNQPPWLRVYRTARAAHRAAMTGKARVCLFNFETNCARFGLLPQPGEDDQARYQRWLAGVDRAVPATPVDSGHFSTIAETMGTHEDGLLDVVEMARINSSTVFPDPAISDAYYFRPNDLIEMIEAGAASLHCIPLGYGGYFDSRLFHAGPARATAGGHPLVGPHLPKPGQLALGRNRTMRRKGAGLFADDMN